jgi:Bacterial CdiA-CT RNAse A domain
LGERVRELKASVKRNAWLVPASAMMLALFSCGGSSRAPSDRATPAEPTRAEAKPNTDFAVGGARPYDLERDESRGGHTLTKHIGRSDQELLERLDRERNISASSTWTNRELAEEAIGETIAHNGKLERWQERGGRKPNLVLDYHGSPSHPVGRCMARGTTKAVPAYDALIVLKAYGGDDFFVLTAYPECPR